MRRRRRRGGNPTANALRYIAPVARNTNPTAVKKPRGGVTPAGSIRIKKKEFIAVYKSDSYGYIKINPNYFPWLKNIAKSFDRFTVHDIVVYWKPLVGTNVAGGVYLGVDWDGTNVDMVSSEKAQKAVVSCQPVREAPVWQNVTMSLPRSKLMTRKEYRIKIENDTGAVDFDCLPGYILYYVSGPSGNKSEERGNIWIEYDLTLFGTQHVA